MAAGSYTLIAARGTTVVDRHPIEIDLAYTLPSIAPVTSHIQLERQSAQDYRTVPTDLAITIANTGTAPLKVQNIRLKGFPNPIAGDMTWPNKQPGSKWHDYIGVNRQATLKTTDRPLVYPGTTVVNTDVAAHWQHPTKQCHGKTTPATIAITMAHLGRQAHSVEVTYTGSPLTPQIGYDTWVCEGVTISKSTANK